MNRRMKQKTLVYMEFIQFILKFVIPDFERNIQTWQVGRKLENLQNQHWHSFLTIEAQRTNRLIGGLHGLYLSHDFF